MRAINLVPADARTGGVSGGKSNGGVFAFLGALAVLFVCTGAYAQSKGKEATANKDLATVQNSAAAYQQVATKYSSFQSAASDAQARIATVKSLASARFDWAGSLRDLARLVPATVRISQLNASVSVSSGSGGSQFRSAIQSPAITMSGCTLSQSTAANLVTQLQAMRRVTNVTLEYSKLSDQHGAKVEDGSCTDYDFAIDVFFAPGSAQDSSSASPSAVTASSVTSTTPGATTPAATTPTNAGN